MALGSVACLVLMMSTCAAALTAELPFGPCRGGPQGSSVSRVAISDARGQSFSLHEDGFTTLTGLSTLSGACLKDFDCVRDGRGHESYRYIEHLLASVCCPDSPSARALVFTHKHRKQQNSPTKTVHCDIAHPFQAEALARSKAYAMCTQPGAVLEHCSRVEAVLLAPYYIVNVWLPLQRVRRDPLAVCRWPAGGRSDDEMSRPVNRPDDEWYFTSEMMPGEALAFKQHDSRGGAPGLAAFTPHAAFSLRASVGRERKAAEPPPRESVEYRAVVFEEGALLCA